MALTKKQREKLRMKFGGRCAYCVSVKPMPSVTPAPCRLN